MELANELVALAAGGGVLAVMGFVLITAAIVMIDLVIEIIKDWRGKR